MAEDKFDGMEDFSPDLITLLDENGEEQDFEIIDAVEYNGNTYIALMPVDEDDCDCGCEEGHFVILRSEIDEEAGEEYYASIEDEDELEAVLEEFNKKLEEDDYRLEI